MKNQLRKFGRIALKCGLALLGLYIVALLLIFVIWHPTSFPLEKNTKVTYDGAAANSRVYRSPSGDYYLSLEEDAADGIHHSEYWILRSKRMVLLSSAIRFSWPFGLLVCHPEDTVGVNVKHREKTGIHTPKVVMGQKFVEFNGRSQKPIRVEWPVLATRQAPATPTQ